MCRLRMQQNRNEYLWQLVFIVNSISNNPNGSHPLSVSVRDILGTLIEVRRLILKVGKTIPQLGSCFESKAERAEHWCSTLSAS